MVFETLKTKFLQAQLKRANATSKVDTAKAKKQINKLVKFEKAKRELLKSKLRKEIEIDLLQSKIARAKQLKLTPAEKKILQKRILNKKLQIKKIKDISKQGINLISKGFKALGAHLDSVEERNKRTNKRRKKS